MGSRPACGDFRDMVDFVEPWSVDDPDMKLGQDCYIVRDANATPTTSRLSAAAVVPS